MNVCVRVSLSTGLDRMRHVGYLSAGTAWRGGLSGWGDCRDLDVPPGQVCTRVLGGSSATDAPSLTMEYG